MKAREVADHILYTLAQPLVDERDADAASRLIEQYAEHRMEQMRRACGDAAWKASSNPADAGYVRGAVLRTPLPPEEP